MNFYGISIDDQTRPLADCEPAWTGEEDYTSIDVPEEFKTVPINTILDRLPGAILQAQAQIDKIDVEINTCKSLHAAMLAKKKTISSKSTQKLLPTQDESITLSEDEEDLNLSVDLKVPKLKPEFLPLANDFMYKVHATKLVDMLDSWDTQYHDISAFVAWESKAEQMIITHEPIGPLMIRKIVSKQVRKDSTTMKHYLTALQIFLYPFPQLLVQMRSMMLAWKAKQHVMFKIMALTKRVCTRSKVITLFDKRKQHDEEDGGIPLDNWSRKKRAQFNRFCQRTKFRRNTNPRRVNSRQPTQKFRPNPPDRQFQKPFQKQRSKGNMNNYTYKVTGNFR